MDFGQSHPDHVDNGLIIQANLVAFHCITTIDRSLEVRLLLGLGNLVDFCHLGYLCQNSLIERSHFIINIDLHHVWQGGVLLTFLETVYKQTEVGSVECQDCIIVVFLETRQAGLDQLETFVFNRVVSILGVHITCHSFSAITSIRRLFFLMDILGFD